MNAYEQRKAQRMLKDKIRYSERRSIKLLNRDQAEKFYSDAFFELNAQRPLVIPKINAEELIRAGQLMLARVHEIELGGNDET